MLDFHKANKADVTLACMPVPWGAEITAAVDEKERSEHTGMTS